MIKRLVRNFIRAILIVREEETISNAVDRYFVKIKKLFYTTKFDSMDLKNALLELGLTSGDNLMVHSSWRQFYNYSGNPEEIINIICDIIGNEGTLCMPSYGSNRLFFDIENTPSNAGVISEVFRNLPKVHRSESTHFSIAALGPLAENIVKYHFYSEYGFDRFSPYYRFSTLNNAKILFLGLGSEPTKISLFHCAAYILKDEDPYLKDLLSYRYTSELVKDGKIYKKEMISRKPGHKNNNKVFKKIYRAIQNKSNTTISNLDIVVIDAGEGLKKAIEFTIEKIYCYK